MSTHDTPNVSDDVPVASATARAARPLSLSSLVYLFCDRMVLAAKAGTVGQRCLSTGRVVETKTLATRLGEVAVLGLREAGSISLERYEGKKLFVKVRGVRATMLGLTASYGGIEEYLLSYWPSSRKVGDGHDVGDAFNLMMPSGPNPYGHVIQSAIDECVAHSYAHYVGQERSLKDKLGHKPARRLEPNHDQIAAIKQEFEAFVDRWNIYIQTERPLHDELVRTIYNGLSSRASKSSSLGTDF